MTELYPFQKEGVALIEQFNGTVLLADEMGLGKTIQSLEYIVKHKVYPALVICPASLKENWKSECKKHYNIDAVVLSGSKQSLASITDHPQIVIVNYDILSRRYKELKEYNWEIVVLDECHYIKSEKAQRTKYAVSLCSHIDKCIAISGTPILSNPFELYNVLYVILGNKLESRSAFIYKYCVMKRNFWSGQMEYVHGKNLDDLHGRLKTLCMIRRLKRDVLKELPEKHRNIINIKLNSIDARSYKSMNKDLLTWLRVHKNTQKFYMDSKVKFGYLMRQVAHFKFNQCMDWVLNFLESTGDRKIILFAIHHGIMNRMEEVFDHLKIKYVRIDGNVSQKDKQHAADQFQNNPKIRVLIGQIIPAGVGWTFTAASDVAFFELHTVPAIHHQAEDRIHRIGQKDGATAHYFITEDTIEERVQRKLLDKDETSNSILEGFSYSNFLMENNE
jgi:SWI/SNF-related matrix-associated actin-dependent regulator 1 of chromatin subfamily A